jgi:hypothetical protein
MKKKEKIKELEKKNMEMLSMIDGALEVIELFGYKGSPAQKEWAKNWYTRAIKLGASTFF